MDLYTGSSANYPGQVRIPDDGDPRNATTFAAAIEDLADRTAYLANRSPGAGGSKFEVPLERGRAEAGWNKTDTYALTFWTQTNPTLYVLRFPISDILPEKCRIIWFSALMKGAASHAGWPANRPLVRIARYWRSGAYNDAGEVVSAAQPFDTTTQPLSTYQNLHLLSKTLTTPHTPTAGYLYFMEIIGENGSNYLDGLLVQALNFEVAP
jgi:hypothetical protein